MLAQRLNCGQNTRCGIYRSFSSYCSSYDTSTIRSSGQLYCIVLQYTHKMSLIYVNEKGRQGPDGTISSRRKLADFTLHFSGFVYKCVFSDISVVRIYDLEILKKPASWQEARDGERLSFLTAQNSRVFRLWFSANCELALRGSRVASSPTDRI